MMSVSVSADQDHSASGFQKYEFDLTRLCLRRGTVELPGSMLGLFEAGEVVLRDPVGDQTHTLTFTPPRTLASLKAFFEHHSLQPNDKLVLLLDDEGGEIHALRRPKKRSTAGRAVQVQPGEITPELVRDGPAQVREVRQRVREEEGEQSPPKPLRSRQSRGVDLRPLPGPLPAMMPPSLPNPGRSGGLQSRSRPRGVWVHPTVRATPSRVGEMPSLWFGSWPSWPSRRRRSSFGSMMSLRRWACLELRHSTPSSG